MQKCAAAAAGTFYLDCSVNTMHCSLYRVGLPLALDVALAYFSLFTCISKVYIKKALNSNVLFF